MRLAKFFKKIICLSISCWFTFNFNTSLRAQSKQLAVERFSAEDGLPNTIIFDIVQDQQGYIWLATQDGLVRYDGYRFFNYRNIPGDSTTLTQNRIEKIYVGHNFKKIASLTDENWMTLVMKKF